MTQDELHLLARKVRMLSGVIHKAAIRGLEQSLSERDIGISVLQYAVLRHIYHRAHDTISALSRAMMLTPATLVPVIDGLESHGFVRRRRDKTDRRRILLDLTKKGEDLLNNMPHLERHDNFYSGLSKLGPEKTRQLASLLEELAAQMVDDEELREGLEMALRDMSGT